MQSARRESGGRGPGKREGGPPSGGKRQYFRRRKVCKFCEEKIDSIDYKDVRLVSQFISERGKILPRRLTGTCSPHQHLLTVAIKRARNIALVPFASAATYGGTFAWRVIPIEAGIRISPIFTEARFFRPLARRAAWQVDGIRRQG
jgi:small subunit ribosomal protein S18